jgi:carbamoyl-phosphate synthase small subunit
MSGFNAKATLVLLDGRIFSGKSFGAGGETVGEVVFNTGMTGYQEVLTDPSYRGQIVTMTYPLVGNCGVNLADVESGRVWVEGFVVREISPLASSWRSSQTLPDYLAAQGIVGISDVDTRAVTRHIRATGAMPAIISTIDHDPASLLAKVRSAPSIIGRDLVSGVTCREIHRWEGGSDPDRLSPDGDGKHPEPRFRVAAFDFGMKRNILRLMAAEGMEVTILPAGTSADDCLALKPDGVFLSNGPGDPAALTGPVNEIRRRVGRVPLFGICLGHQLLGLALGGTTHKLLFGHHGVNHPVMDLRRQRVEITSQNHNFVVDAESIPGGEGTVEVTHLNLNDKTLEGFRHRSLPLMAVQYHPESGPGPHDSRYLFEDFATLMDRGAR